MAEVLEGSGERQVVGLRGRGQDVVHPLGSFYGGVGGQRRRKRCSAVSDSQKDGAEQQLLGGVSHHPMDRLGVSFWGICLRKTGFHCTACVA